MRKYIITTNYQIKTNLAYEFYHYTKAASSLF
jgi:hypothetical protein